MSQEIKYNSTRGKDKNLFFEDVLLSGLASDGGLFLPDKYPFFTKKDLIEMSNLNYIDLATKIISEFVSEDLKPKVNLICKKVYSKFGHEEIAPIVKIKNNLYIQELFHGPTLAFKDYAMQFLSELFQEVLENQDKKIVILGATSGDTGSAALEAFKSNKKINVFILFPHGRVSEVQRKQMTTITQKGCFPIAVKTDFDGCQELVKSCFNDKDFKKEVSLSAINSINWARLLPQTIYYFYSALKLGVIDKKISFSVPTGNFGNILAGWIAKKMGLPINKLICGTNKNDILYRFFNSNKMERKKVSESLSPSMDIQVSSNFERLLYEFVGRDSYKIVKFMEDFDNFNFYQLDNKYIQKMKKTFLSFRVNDDKILKTIEKIYQENNYIIDPHTAVGVSACFQAINEKNLNLDNTNIISLACAHPSKFPKTIHKSLNFYPENPSSLNSILSSNEQFDVIEKDIDVLKKIIMKETSKNGN